MADFSTAIEYEKTHPVTITDPRSGEATGIVIHVVSQDSARVTKALREYQSKQWAREAAGEAVDLAESLSERTRLILVESIDSWEWGEHSFAHINNDAPATKENREFLVDHANAKWLTDQIADGCANVQNFMQPLQKSARTGSKKT